MRSVMRSGSDKVFDAVNIILLLLITLIMIYPMYFTVVASFSDPTEVALGRTHLIFKGFNLDAYTNVIKNSGIWTGYGNSIFVMTFGTVLSLAVTIPCAYAISRRYLRGRNLLMIYFMITMYFGGGLIPSYLVHKTLGLVNKLPVLIIDGAFSVYNMIIVRTFYQSSFPDELYEAARLDGCSEIGIFFRIAMPISGAIVAVIALYNAVGHWNSYFGALIYLSDQGKWPLQLVLRSILVQNQNMTISQEQMDIMMSDPDGMAFMLKKQRLAETMKYSLIFISSLPMLIAYPFVQKFFVKGVMIGSVKG